MISFYHLFRYIKYIYIAQVQTSFGKEANNDDKSNHPASFSTVAATGLRLCSVSIFFETPNTNPGSLVIAHYY